MDLCDFLKSSGWTLSSDGLSLCLKECKEKGWTPDAKTVLQVALNLDLRTVADPSLSEGLTHGGTKAHKVEGPIVLQIQRVRNVAVPSSKQHDPHPSKRLLRIQLTDGHTHIGATEIEGPIEKLSPATPPGTKVRIRGSIPVVNGFILLKKSSIEVLGGMVETLLTKWNLLKAMPDNIDREKGGNEDGPPPFVKFNKMSSDSRKKRESAKQVHKYPSPIPEAVSTREKMELPQSYQSQGEEGGGKKVGQVQSNFKKQGSEGAEENRHSRQHPKKGPTTLNTESEGDYAPSQPLSNLCLSGYFSKLPLFKSSPRDIEDIVEPKRISGGTGDGGTQSTEKSSHRRGNGGPSSQGGRKEEIPGVRGSGKDQVSYRGRGRGRRPDRGGQEGYDPKRQKDPYKLIDYIQAHPGSCKFNEKEEKDDVLKDYEYDAKSDQYYIKGSIPDYNTKDPAEVALGEQQSHIPYDGKKSQHERPGKGFENRGESGRHQHESYTRGKRGRSQQGNYDTRLESGRHQHESYGTSRGESGRSQHESYGTSRGESGRSQHESYGTSRGEGGRSQHESYGTSRGEGGRSQHESYGTSRGEGGRSQHESYGTSRGEGGRSQHESYGTSRGEGGRQHESYGTSRGEGGRQHESYGTSRGESGRHQHESYTRGKRGRSQHGNYDTRLEGGRSQHESYGTSRGEGGRSHESYGTSRGEGGRSQHESYGTSRGEGGRSQHESYGTSRGEGGRSQHESYGTSRGEGGRSHESYGTSRGEGGRSQHGNYDTRLESGRSQQHEGYGTSRGEDGRSHESYGTSRGEGGRSQQHEGYGTSRGEGGRSREKYGVGKRETNTSDQVLNKFTPAVSERADYWGHLTQSKGAPFSAKKQL